MKATAAVQLELCDMCLTEHEQTRICETCGRSQCESCSCYCQPSIPDDDALFRVIKRELRCEAAAFICVSDEYGYYITHTGNASPFFKGTPAMRQIPMSERFTHPIAEMHVPYENGSGNWKENILAAKTITLADRRWYVSLLPLPLEYTRSYGRELLVTVITPV